MENLQNEPDTGTQDAGTTEDSNQGYEKRYKDVQSWATKVSQENKELKSQLDKMSGEVSALMQTVAKPEPEEAKPWLADVEPIDLVDDPDKLVHVLKELKEQNDALRSQLPELLEARDGALSERFSQYSPEAQAAKRKIEQYSDKIAELRQEEGLSDLSDIALAKIAEKISPQDDDVSFNNHLPTVGGHRAVINQQKKDQKLIDSWLESNGYTESNGFKKG